MRNLSAAEWWKKDLPLEAVSPAGLFTILQSDLDDLEAERAKQEGALRATAAAISDSQAFLTNCSVRALQLVKAWDELLRRENGQAESRRAL